MGEISRFRSIEHRNLSNPDTDVAAVFTARVPKWQCSTPEGCKVGQPTPSHIASHSLACTFLLLDILSVDEPPR